MLAAQISYWDLVERKRHNLVSERQNDRNLSIQEGELNVHQGQLEESRRHNLVVESYNFQSLDETIRHNMATERLTGESNTINLYNADTNRMNAETNRINAATNAAMIPISWYNAETSRSSQESQAWYNNQRADVDKRNVAATEKRNEILALQTDYNYEIGSRQASVAEQNANTNYLNLMQFSRQLDIQEAYNTEYFKQHQMEINIEKGRLINDIAQGTWRNLNESLKITKESNKRKGRYFK